MLMRVQFSETYSETTQSGYFSFLHIGRNVILAHITVSIWPMLIILPFNSALTTRIEIYGPISVERKETRKNSMSGKKGTLQKMETEMDKLI